MSNNAVLFPGQGSLGPLFATETKATNAFQEHLVLLEKAVGLDLLSLLKCSEEAELTNEESSLLVFACNSYFYKSYLEENSWPVALAGYSVGQWSAIAAAGGVSLEEGAILVSERAKIMSKVVEQHPSGMLAIIGLDEKKIRPTLEKFNSAGHFADIANYNCLGQYTISASRSCIKELHQALTELNPKKCVSLPVAGGWHSDLLADASAAFRARLEKVDFKLFSIPVIDNVNGNFLPTSEEKLKEQLANHISNPVRWSSCIKSLIEFKVELFYEVGLGSMLTKFGFFIDRKVKHKKYETS